MQPRVPKPPVLARSIAVLRSFAIAGAGGFVFWLLHFPAAWIAGGTVAVAIAAIARVEIAMPARVRDVIFVFLGISMGAGVTPETMARLPQWPISLFFVALSVVGITGGTFLFFRHVAKWDWRTALTASIPGALSYVMVVAMESGADLRRVAIAQSVRLVVLIVALPLLVVGFTPGGIATPPAPQGTIAELGLLLTVGIAAGVLADRLKVPAGLMTGAFFASVVLHGAGIAHANLPDWLLVPCFMGISVVIGARFAGTDRALLRQTFLVSIGGFVIGGLIALVCVVLTVVATDAGWGMAALAFAPGGLEAMIALSFALSLDPAFVAGHQLFRFMGIALFMPGAFLALHRKYGDR